MNEPTPYGSLLDEGLVPVADLARIAMREGVRPRATYQAHKWFARRLAITARTLLVAASAKRGDSFWKEFYKGDSWKGRSVLDPFVGGGVMLLEASRLGAKVFGVDIEPVAAAITRFQSTLKELPHLASTVDKLILDIGKELAPFYQTESERGSTELLLHAFWVQVVKCGECSHIFDAHPTFRFAWDQDAKTQWVACAGCCRVLKTGIATDIVRCRCGKRTKTSAGRIEQGQVTCPKCEHKEKLIDYARRTKTTPSFRLFAVETLPSDERRVTIRARTLRSATVFDQQRFSDAEKKLKEVLSVFPDALPKGPIPRYGRSDNRLIDYGYKDYMDLFNSRQKLHLALLGKAILKLGGAERTAFAIAFSDHLTTNNMLCAYAGGWRRLTPLFSIRSYRHIARPVEINPWLRNNGRGTFLNAVRAVERASNAIKNPMEPRRDGSSQGVSDASSDAADIVCGDARHMKHIASQSIDLVLTDPPYFDYIPYSELGHFFTPWFVRFGLIHRKFVDSFPKGQIASTARSAVAERLFARRLVAAFKEIRRVSKPQGRIVFTYQNLDGRGWNAIAQAMARAGIIPIRVLPLYGDSSASLHKKAQSISWDAVMICKLGQPIDRLRIEPEALHEGAKIANSWSTKLLAKTLTVTDGDRINIAHAAAIVSAFASCALVNIESVA